MSSDGADKAIKLSILVLIASIILPIAFNNWFAANTGSWGNGVGALWPVIPVIALIGLLYVIYNRYVK